MKIVKTPYLLFLHLEFMLISIVTFNQQYTYISANERRQKQQELLHTKVSGIRSSVFQMCLRKAETFTSTLKMQ